MKISQKLGLGRPQSQLDFIDIDLNGDTPLFVDPYYLSIRQDQWSMSATRTVRSFFQTFLDLVRAGKDYMAFELFGHLGEPNETRLGMSKGAPQGRGVGPEDSLKIFESLKASRAIQTGLLENLEDSRLFVQGVDKDKVSDMTTNIIRSHLVGYTIAQCELWNVPLIDDVPTGFMWDRESQSWINDFAPGLILGGDRILLVPKAIVSFAARYTPQDYYRHFVLNFLKEDHLRRNTIFVQKSYDKRGRIKRRWVTKKSLMEKEAKYSKDFLVDFTHRHPEVFKAFKDDTKRRLNSTGVDQVSPAVVRSVAEGLIEQLNVIEPGSAGAGAYHTLVTGILEFLFYPRLTCPLKEREIHEGRKRIDITFDNSATTGFFHHLHSIHGIPSSYIMVECKNYSADVANPELDQLSGRFSPNRGRFGISVCRKIENLERFIARCGDTCRDDRGLVIPLLDADIVTMLREAAEGEDTPGEQLLIERMRQIRLQ